MLRQTRSCIPLATASRFCSSNICTKAGAQTAPLQRGWIHSTFAPRSQFKWISQPNRSYATDWLERVRKTSYKNPISRERSAELSSEFAETASANRNSDFDSLMATLKKPNWDTMKTDLAVVNKNFYTEHPKLAAMTEAQVL